MSSRLVLSLGLLVSLAMPAMTRAAEDMRLGEGVTWMRSATSLEPPRGLDLEPYDLSEEPDENLVVELYRIGYRLSDETIERSVTRVYKYLSEDAIRDHGNLRSYFDASGDRLEIARAFVVDSDGRMHPTEPNTVQILPTDTFDIFSDGRYALLPLKGLDAGSRAVIVDRIISRRDASVAPWGVMPTLQFGVPQERIEISVEWTRPELKPEWRVDLESIACEESDQAVRCEATDVPPYEVDSDVYYDDVLPRFYVAEPRDWQDIRRWYSSLFGSAISSSDSVAAMASRLSDGLDDETEKLKAIHEFVATQVRYVGLEHGDSAYVPHDTALTLERRYGDCKDKTALLIDMLSQVGIDMSPVLVATDRRDPDRLLVPSSSYFDHLIVCGTLSNGKEYCLDGTDPYTGTETLSRWIQGAVALPVHGESGPVTLPVDEYQWVLDEDLTLTLTDDGGLLESSRVDYKGVYGSVIRGIVSGMSSTELRDWARDDYHATVSELADPEFRIEGTQAINDDVSISWTTRYDDITSTADDLSYYERSAWLSQVAASLASTNTVYPYRFPGLRYTGRATINVADLWHVNRASPSMEMQTEFGSVTRTRHIAGNKVVIETSVLAPAATIGVDDVPRLKRFLDILDSESYIRVGGSLKDRD